MAARGTTPRRAIRPPTAALVALVLAAVLGPPALGPRPGPPGPLPALADPSPVVDADHSPGWDSLVRPPAGDGATRHERGRPAQATLLTWAFAGPPSPDCPARNAAPFAPAGPPLRLLHCRWLN